jgi:4-hydroxythreonine-4-phosphate dehydrogenase
LLLQFASGYKPQRVDIGMRNRMDRVTIALMLGDRYGIGPEIVAKFLSEAGTPNAAQIVVVGDRRVFDFGLECAGTQVPYQIIDSLSALHNPDTPRLLLDRPMPEASVQPLGRVSAESGREVLDTFRYLVGCARSGDIDGIVYAPLNKQSMRLTGMTDGDELGFLVDLMGDSGVGELNLLNSFWTSRVTSHIPLRAVADRITEDAVLAAIRLVHRSLLESGNAQAKIAVSGLNPHAGDGGAFGDEEIRIIGPAIELAKQEGIDVDGPFSPDTVFLQAQAGRYHAIVSMYHDQGQVAMKLMGFGHGVTLLAGFPIPITTPAHGTAFDIAGKGLAKADGLKAAVSLCTSIAHARRRHKAGAQQLREIKP